MTVSRPLRVSRLVAIAMTACAVALSGLAATEAVGASSGAPADAAAAKKKKKKKCRKKGKRSRKCKRRGAPKRAPSRQTPPGQPPASGSPGGSPQQPGSSVPQGAAASARFTELLTGSLLQTVSASSSGSSQSNGRYDFCNGTFSYYGESIGQYTASTTSYNGTWEVKEAEFAPDGNSARARVAYTTNKPDEYPPGEVIVSLVGANQAYIDETEYQRTAGGASC